MSRIVIYAALALLVIAFILHRLVMYYENRAQERHRKDMKREERDEKLLLHDVDEIDRQLYEEKE